MARIRCAQWHAVDVLHLVLQDVMGWTNSHLHEFEIHGTRFAPPDVDGEFDDDSEDSSSVRLSELALKPGDTFQYLYDFGDGWEHIVAIQEVGVQGSSPRCLNGARACPPEDCGGPGGCSDLLDRLNDPSHPEHRDMVDWIGDEFDPAKSDVNEVNALLEER
jgi:hypothetical protein